MKRLLLVLLISPLFISHPSHTVGVGDTMGIHHIKPPVQKTIKNTPLSDVEPAVEVAVAKPIMVVSGVTNCGSDPYQILVYQRESGCKTNSVNSIGCTGIGQACPGSKLPCSLSDWDCQNNFFTAYMLSRYGSWASAWQSEVSRGWW